MTTIATIVTLLLNLAPVMSLGCIIAAGLSLRGDGGVSFELGGNFARWMMWALVFLCLPSLPSLMSALGFSVLQAPVGGSSSGAAGMITAAVTTFVQTFLLAKLVPVVAGYLVLKALLDSAEDKPPLPSIVAALFVLSLNGIWTLAKSWVGGGTDAYSFTTGLEGGMHYLAYTICPIASVFCVIGALISWLRNKRFAHLIYTALAMGTVTALFNLAAKWGLAAIPK